MEEFLGEHISYIMWADDKILDEEWGEAKDLFKKHNLDWEKGRQIIEKNLTSLIDGVPSADEEGERKARPIPLTEKEVANIFKRIEAAQPRAKIGLAKGQNVKVVDGPFSEFIGVVDEVLPDKGKVRVLVSFFGRETPVELDFLQAERIG